jgi:hypothetical protein
VAPRDEIGCPHGVAVDGGVVRRGHVERGLEVPGQGPSEGLADGNEFRSVRADHLGEDPGLGVGDGEHGVRAVLYRPPPDPTRGHCAPAPLLV